MAFEWDFDEKSLRKANESTVEDDIFGFVSVTDGNQKYLVDIHKEYYSPNDRDFDLEIFTECEEGGHGEWLGSVRIKQADSLRYFKSRAKELLEQFVAVA